MNRAFSWGVVGSSQRTVPRILGESLYRWQRGDMFEPAGAPGGFARWVDLSGNGFHADSASVGGNPTAGSTVNGKPALTFDGVGNFLTTTETLAQCRIYHDGSARVVQWVAHEQATATLDYLGGTCQGGANVGLQLAVLGTAGIRAQSSIGPDYLIATTGSTLTNERAVVVADFDNPEASVQVFGETESTALAVDDTPSGSPDAGDPQTLFEMGRRPNVADYYPGKIAEWVVAVGPTDAQVAAVTQLLRSYYGLV